MANAIDYLKTYFGEISKLIEESFKLEKVNYKELKEELKIIEKIKEKEEELDELIEKFKRFCVSRRINTDNFLSHKWFDSVSEYYKKDVYKEYGIIEDKELEIKDEEKKLEDSFHSIITRIKRINGIINASIHKLKEIEIHFKQITFKNMIEDFIAIENDLDDFIKIVFLYIKDEKKAEENSDFELLEMIINDLEEKLKKYFKNNIQDSLTRLNEEYRKILKGQDELTTNEFIFERNIYRLFGSNGVKSKLNKNYYLKKILINNLDIIVKEGINSIHGRKPVAEGWVFLGDLVRGELNSGARIFYKLEEDKILIGDVFTESEHGSKKSVHSDYKEALREIDKGKYKINASKELDFFIKRIAA
ncbi:hypothetical protein KY334_03970 [Candidatus Woesearchaeota archaeon]|nr:hypothetical protein [Candidatus Woesearchaeota archaeon]